MSKINSKTCYGAITLIFISTLGYVYDTTTTETISEDMHIKITETTHELKINKNIIPPAVIGIGGFFYCACLFRPSK